MDGAPEFKSEDFTNWCKQPELGIQLNTGMPYAHHHQHKVERMHRTAGNSSRAMRYTANLGKEFWPFSQKQAAAARNLVPTQAKMRAAKGGTKRAITPWELWEGQSKYLDGDYSILHKHLLPTGCGVVYHVPKEARRKRDAHGELGIYLCSNGVGKATK